MNEAQEIASLLSRINTICYQGDGDGMESISLERWDGMTVEELRTVVILLDDGILDLIRAQDNMRRPCFLIKSLFEYITSSENALHPYTRVPITALQRQRIVQAYSRLHPDEFERYVVGLIYLRSQEQEEEERQQQQQQQQQNDRPAPERLIYPVSTPAAIAAYRRDFGEIPPDMSYEDRTIWNLRRRATILQRLIPEEVARLTDRANEIRQRRDLPGSTAAANNLMALVARVRQAMQNDANEILNELAYYEGQREMRQQMLQDETNRPLRQESAIGATGATIGPSGRGEEVGTGVEEEEDTNICTIM